MILIITSEDVAESRFFLSEAAESLGLTDIVSVFRHQGYFSKFLRAMVFRILNRDAIDGQWSIDDSINEIIKMYGIDKKQRDKVLHFYTETIIEVKRLIGNEFVNGNLYEVQKVNPFMGALFTGDAIKVSIAIPKETIERFSDLIKITEIVTDLLAENNLCLN